MADFFDSLAARELKDLASLGASAAARGDAALAGYVDFATRLLTDYIALVRSGSYVRIGARGAQLCRPSMGDRFANCEKVPIREIQDWVAAADNLVGFADDVTQLVRERAVLAASVAAAARSEATKIKELQPAIESYWKAKLLVPETYNEQKKYVASAADVAQEFAKLAEAGQYVRLAGAERNCNPQRRPSDGRMLAACPMQPIGTPADAAAATSSIFEYGRTARGLVDRALNPTAPLPRDQQIARLRSACGQRGVSNCNFPCSVSRGFFRNSCSYTPQD